MRLFKQILLFTSLSFALFGIAKSTDVEASNLPEINVVVGTEGVMNPFTFFDENNRLTGFDIEVVRSIEKIDPKLKFTFATGVWDSLFPGLDAGHYQMLANQIAYNEMRAERYLLTDEFYFRGGTQPITLKSRESEFKTMDDLKGKRVAAGVGSNHSLVLENWNNNNGKAINIIYYDGEVGLMFQDLLNYRVDAFMNSPAAASYQAKANNVEIAYIGEPFYDANIHFIFPKTKEGEILKKRIDDALKTLREKGTLKELSIQFFGQDLT